MKRPTSAILVFSHPDYTVGTGIAPVQLPHGKLADFNRRSGIVDSYRRTLPRKPIKEYPISRSLVKRKCQQFPGVTEIVERSEGTERILLRLFPLTEDALGEIEEGEEQKTEETNGHNAR